MVRRDGPWTHEEPPQRAYVSTMAGSTTVDVDLTGPGGPVALLQAIADPIRWAVLDSLADGQRCVCDLQERMAVPGNLLSYHLKVLREAGLVVATRRGRWVDYALASDAGERLQGALPGARKAVTV